MVAREKYWKSGCSVASLTIARLAVTVSQVLEYTLVNYQLHYKTSDLYTATFLFMNASSVEEKVALSEGIHNLWDTHESQGGEAKEI